MLFLDSEPSQELIDCKRNARIQHIDFIDILELDEGFYRAFCLAVRHIAR
jgi:hypothetical protein